MKLFTSIGPNPRIVAMFAAEKGLLLKTEHLDVIAGENRRAPYLAVNPLGTTPALVLDDGQAITETIAACEYLEELHPTPSLIGATPAQRAAVRTWTRRIDLGFVVPLTLAFRAREGRALFAPRMTVAPETAAPDLYRMAFDGIDLVERLCSGPGTGSGAGSSYVAGADFSLADILLFCFVDFGRAVGTDVLPGRAWLTDWHARVAARPSANPPAD